MYPASCLFLQFCKGCCESLLNTLQNCVKTSVADPDPKDPHHFAGSGSIKFSMDPDVPHPTSITPPLLPHPSPPSPSPHLPHPSAFIPQLPDSSSLNTAPFPPSSLTPSPSSLICTPHLSSLVP